MTVRWRLDGEREARRFHLAWREEGGPPVLPPARRGFGSQLIEAALAAELAGSAEIHYDVAGVRFVLDADAARWSRRRRKAPPRRARRGARRRRSSGRHRRGGGR